MSRLNTRLGSTKWYCDAACECPRAGKGTPGFVLTGGRVCHMCTVYTQCVLRPRTARALCVRTVRFDCALFSYQQMHLSYQKVHFSYQKMHFLRRKKRTLHANTLCVRCTHSVRTVCAVHTRYMYGVCLGCASNRARHTCVFAQHLASD